MKYSESLVRKICKNLSDGLHQKDVCMLVGINEDTFYTWKKEKSEFSESVDKAIAKYKQKLVLVMTNQALQDGKMAMDILSRRWPEEYGVKSSVMPQKIQEEPKVIGSRYPDNESDEDFAKHLIEIGNEVLGKKGVAISS